MAEPRPFPPSTRRSALARAAGLHPASPILVGAIACAAAVIAAIALGRAAAARLGAWVMTACESPARFAASARGGGAAPSGGPLGGVPHGTLDGSAAGPLDGVAHGALDGAAPGALDGAAHGALDLAALPRAVLELALPLLVAAALAAIVAHLAQTRAVWLPRRRLPGAPAPEPQRVRRAVLDLTAVIVIGAVAIGWLWLMAPRLAAAIGSPLAGAALIASLVAAIAIAWVGLGTGDALVRHAELAGALRMSHADKREDDRLSGADPRWRARRAEVARETRTRRPRGTPAMGGALLVLGDDVASAIAGSSVLLLGDGIAVAIAWDPAHRPVPTTTAIGRGPHATQLLGLARRHAIAVHRDPELTSALPTTVGPVPAATWPRLAEIIAAARGRRGS
jgi:type III secretion system FlhB-like substrate exporter